MIDSTTTPLITALLNGKRYINEFFGEDEIEETIAELPPPQFDVLMREVAENQIPMTCPEKGVYEIYGMLFREVCDG